MIDFKCNEADVKRACFAGDIQTITAELCLEISFLYGSLSKRNKDAAEHFKFALSQMFVDSDINKAVFSEELVEAVCNGNGISVSIDNEEFAKQLMELMRNENE